MIWASPVCLGVNWRDLQAGVSENKAGLEEPCLGRVRQEWPDSSGRGRGPVGQAGEGRRQEGQRCRVNSLLRTESPDFETPLGTQNCLLESSLLCWLCTLPSQGS